MCKVVKLLDLNRLVFENDFVKKKWRFLNKWINRLIIINSFIVNNVQSKIYKDFKNIGIFVAIVGSKHVLFMLHFFNKTEFLKLIEIF